MKLMVVAHPDDEIIWFEPTLVDRIIIVFGKRNDLEHISSSRKIVIQEHPHSEIIEYLELDDDSSVISESNQKIIESHLNSIKTNQSITMVFTHNSCGEYGHHAHKFLNKIVTDIFSEVEIWVPAIYEKQKGSKILLVKRDIKNYTKTKNIYLENDCWTFKHHYVPNQFESFMRAI